MPAEPLLESVAARIRGLRGERGWTRRELAGRSSLSERFLAQVEAGTGNPSLLSLAQIAGALGTSPAALLGAPPEPRKIALLGLRGAGKSTVGRALARRLGWPFVELDALVEEAAGLSLAELFELHGEAAYRRMEREVLGTLIESPGPAVIATGGGIVAHRAAFDLLKRRAVTVWLRASPEEHWNRVVAQGDHRPMANHPLAMAHLRQLLAEREGLYRGADQVVSTTRASVSEVVAAIRARMAGPAPAPRSYGKKRVR